jgi:alanine transaminase
MNALTLDQLNPAIGNVEYAVRGELAIRAEAYRVTLKQAEEKGVSSGLPFDRVIFTNIGNPQQKGLDQPPITFVRQVCGMSFLLINNFFL